MGTRAKVLLNGEMLCVTHWDGNPDKLGKHLVSFFSGLGDSKEKYHGDRFTLKKDYILGVCIMHQVDTAGSSTSDFIKWVYDIRVDGVYCKKSSMDFWRKLPKQYMFGIRDIEYYVLNGEYKEEEVSEQDE